MKIILKKKKKKEEGEISDMLYLWLICLIDILKLK
jgi:hypothetical protein